ncbi:MAG TPA: nitroreductase family protein, partial [Chloroflexi bacterium]|nr:nitroreductase family protein [Chloroflexota bacterium]
TARRSIRKFTDEPVSEEDIDCLLKAAMAAPSASNRRPWEFVVVSDPRILARLRSRLVFGRYYAPLAIVVCGNMRRAYPVPARDFWVQDCSAAMENILLTATALGLGSVWVGVHPVGLFRRGVSRALGLPRHVLPLGVAYIGHPAESKVPRTQYDERRVHRQQYGAGGEGENDDDSAYNL